jgi:Uma2 family endonuclease
MVQIPSRILTLEEFLHMPETKPASEYIDGQIIQKPMPKRKHSVIQTELASTINAVLKLKRTARAFSELRCTYPAGSRSSVYGIRSTVPDVSVFISERIPRDENGEIANVFPIAPDWTIEILSPEQSHTKVTKNILHWLKHGTHMGWLIDLAEQTVFVYLPKQETEVFDESEQLLPVPSFAHELRLSVGELFGWLME